jgi:hypothetical protein
MTRGSWSFVLALCAASTATAAPAVYHQVLVNDSPSLYYLLGETAGPLVNLAPSAARSAGRTTGRLFAESRTPGNDMGVAFDGTDDWIESLGNAPAAFTGNPTMSIETIVRIPTGASSLLWAPFLHWGDANPQTGRSAWFGLQNNNANRLFVGFYNSGLRTVTTIPLGVWHHIVWVRNGGASQSQENSTLYLDSVAIP